MPLALYPYAQSAINSIAIAVKTGATIAAMELLLVSFASLRAGFLDAIVGGGGLILVPALFAVFPTTHPATLLGINKGASVWGTAVATGFIRLVFIGVVNALTLKTGFNAFLK
jgi:hypothetical protein